MMSMKASKYKAELLIIILEPGGINVRVGLFLYYCFLLPFLSGLETFKGVISEAFARGWCIYTWLLEAAFYFFLFLSSPFETLFFFFQRRAVRD